MLPFKRSILYGIYVLGVLGILASGGGGGGGGDEDAVADPIVLGSVKALITPVGARWNDYVDGDERLTATNDNPCAADSPPCIHGGERRVVDVTGRSSCAGLSATDDLGAFDWVCDASTGGARMVSTGLAEGKYLSDLLDFTTPGFRENAVTVFLNGTVFGSTPSSVWWGNPVTINNNGGSLADPSTIYLVTAQPNPAAGFTLDANKVGLVIQPGLALSGTGTSIDVISSTLRDYLWLEGAIDTNGDFNAITISSVRFSALINVTVENALNFGVGLLSASNNTLLDVTASNNGLGVYLDSSSNNTLSGVTASNNSFGLRIGISSSNNTLLDVTASNNSLGVALIQGASNNTLSGVTATNNFNGVTLVDSSNNTLSGVTATNNNNDGVLIQGASNNTLSGVTASNNPIGLRIDILSSNNTLLDVTASNSDAGIRLSNASDNRFTGLLQVGNNAQDCFVDRGTNPGLNPDCSPNGSSDHTLVSGVSVAASFAGKVTSDDAANLSDANGTVTFPLPPTFDWSGFDNPYRGWGVDGSAFPDPDHRGRWSTGAGRIWDWSLSLGDTGNGGNPALLGVVEFPDGDDTLTHSWDGPPGTPDDPGCSAMVVDSVWNGTGCETVFLRNAVEIPTDGIGNDNTLCESGETCLYMPNIGSYQGRGKLAGDGNFTDGTLTGISLLRYASNPMPWFQDTDSDGFGNPLIALAAAVAPDNTWVANSSDCDDSDPTINPDAAEANDMIDNDCDGDVDEDFWKYVFVSSTVHNGGSLGGLAGADAICQNLADAAPLLPAGTYVAWLSTPGNDARLRVTNDVNNNHVYVRTTKIEIARGFADLTDGIDRSILADESGSDFVDQKVWTGTDASGQYSGNSCTGGNWSALSGTGQTGLSSEMDTSWTANGIDSCIDVASLYCFQK